MYADSAQVSYVLWDQWPLESVVTHSSLLTGMYNLFVTGIMCLEHANSSFDKRGSACK